MLQRSLTLPNGAVIQGHHGERYLIEGLLGRGRESVVYLARNRHNRQQVFALKELINPDMQERSHLAFEAELLMRLKHKALPHIYKVFENVKLQRVYLVMDYIVGKDLETLREEQPEKRFSLPLVVALMAPIVDAICYLHAQNPPVIHRDIKPANMIVPLGASETVLVDFGISKEYVEEKTTNVFRYGTAGYAAPEQYGQGTNPRTDIYALAATFYTLLTGTIPTDALTRSVEIQHGDPLLTAHQRCPTVSVAVSRVIEHAMSLRSDDRYTTTLEFWLAMNTAILQQPDGEEAVASSKKPYPFTIALKDVKQAEIANATAKRWPRFNALSQHHNMHLWLFILLMLLALAIGAGSVFASPAWLHIQKTTPTGQGTTNRQAPPPMHVAGCPLPSFVPHAPISPLYIETAPAYTGEVSNNVADVSTKNQSTALCLTDVRQVEDHISGQFSGLSFISTFHGTIAQDSVHFSVSIGDSQTYVFQGGIRAVGDMAGSYHILNQAGQSIGEGGVWEAVPMPVHS